MEQRVARNGLVAVDDGRTSEQLRAVGARVGVGIGGVDNRTLRLDSGRTYDVGYLRTGVVMQGVGGDMVLAREHLDSIIERSLARCRAVCTPVAHETVLAVYQFAALEEVGKTVHAVVVERVGVQGLRAMLQHHVLAGVHHLLGTVVVGMVTGEREGVALPEAHVSESLNRILHLKEVGAVAPQLHSGVLEMHLALEYLGSRHGSPLVVTQLVGMYKIHAFVCFLALLLFVWSRQCCHQAKAKKA